jgi:N-acetylated-alpha-linked acidic dipeptidase
MKKIALISILICLFSGLSAFAQDSMLGYSATSAEKQVRFETAARETVDPKSNRTILGNLADEANMAGTPGDWRNAEYVREFLAGIGFESQHYPYTVYLPYPISAKITLPAENIIIIPGEKGAEGDKYGVAGENIPFNSFSPSGSAEAEVIYANYALPADFVKLTELGVDVKDKVIIARYGRTFRGSKAWEAEKAGAAALILYSDPADDGYFRGDVYPQGSMRPADAVQRGSIYYMFNTPGDPLTPLVPALKDAERLDPAEAGLPKIPTMPISYGDAQKILKRMDGPSVPQAWQGALPFRYHLGSTFRAKVEIENDFQMREIWDTIGMLRGSELPDEWVIVGAHRDSWVYGANDPNSGGAVILEAARVIAETSKKYGNPRRSILIGSWDAEEFGIIGSTEWVEQMREELGAKAVTYINADGIISGSNFGASASPVLRPFYQQILEVVEHPDGQTLFDWWNNKQKEKTDTYKFGGFGGGSDHVGFLLHIGIPCMGGGFGGPSGVYHSTYDNLDWMDKFGDPGSFNSAAASRLYATLLSRLANADVLPYSPTMTAVELKRLIEKFSENDVKLSAETISSWLETVEEIAITAKSVEGKLAAFTELSTEARASIDKLFIASERSFMVKGGVLGRPWNNNVLYAVSRVNGYGQVVFPGLAEAVSAEEIAVAESQISQALNNYLAVLAEIDQN